jgi:hypothetical protein
MLVVIVSPFTVIRHDNIISCCEQGIEPRPNLLDYFPNFYKEFLHILI